MICDFVPSDCGCGLAGRPLRLAFATQMRAARPPVPAPQAAVQRRRRHHHQPHLHRHRCFHHHHSRCRCHCRCHCHCHCHCHYRFLLTVRHHSPNHSPRAGIVEYKLQQPSQESEHTVPGQKANSCYSPSAPSLPSPSSLEAAVSCTSLRFTTYGTGSIRRENSQPRS
jgi:hypothetical protein